jgi:uncharacterized protein YodC (DUF2158 family)
MSLSIGDKVWLKSGGPCMTVSQVGHEGKPDKIYCIWFFESKPESAPFPRDALTLVDPLSMIYASTIR